MSEDFQTKATRSWRERPCSGCSIAHDEAIIDAFLDRFDGALDAASLS
ncbi:MAG: hypothetical protein HQ501_09330 [Rhodospirillales bacterium]|nr:hypothetical protein [Rhodospirillales bacterium]